MVETALNDEDVLAAIGERKLAAIADDTLCRASILGDQPRRQVHAFEMFESEPLERAEPIASATKEFDDFGFARPVFSAQAVETGDKFLNFLFGRFETQVGGFPGIRSWRTLCVEICFVPWCFCRQCGHLRRTVERTIEGSHSSAFNSRRASMSCLKRGLGANCRKQYLLEEGRVKCPR